MRRVKTIKLYDEFIEKTKIEHPDLFEAIGEDYFKEVYNNCVQTEKDCRRIKKAFTTTQLDQKVADLSNVGIDDKKDLIDHARLFGNTLAMIISDDCDALYACPEVATFMRLSPHYIRPDSITPSRIYKSGQFGTENHMIDCYTAPNGVAEKDCLLLHKRNDEWLKLEVKISEYCERKYNAVREKAKNFDQEIDFGKEMK